MVNTLLLILKYRNELLAQVRRKLLEPLLNKEPGPIQRIIDQ